MISSFFAGRVRVRHSALKKQENIDTTLGMLNFYPGVLQAAPNQRTGSLLVHYDPDLIAQSDLQTALQALENMMGEEVEEKKSCSRTLLYTNKQANGLLKASFALCLLSLLGPRRAHIWAGSLFAALAIEHTLRHGDR